mgnify:FL=1
MTCPVCKIQLDKALLHNVEIDYCPQCLGLWFEQEELRWVKDEKDRNLRWLDIDLWKDKNKFKINRGIQLCPFCRLPLYEVHYDKSGIIIALCNLCHGIWLDRGEFKKIIEHLEFRADWEVLNNYVKNVKEEFWEIFAGPETLREEILDFLTILKILNYKFLIQHPTLAKMISN